jgi:hypothetical protein
MTKSRLIQLLVLLASLAGALVAGAANSLPWGP